jgi:hypothetical protein
MPVGRWSDIISTLYVQFVKITYKQNSPYGDYRYTVFPLPRLVN